MTSTLHGIASGGHLAISFPEASMPPQEREDFISFLLKAEWTARQSRFSETDAKALADEVDAGWWARNREHILRSIGTA